MMVYKSGKFFIFLNPPTALFVIFRQKIGRRPEQTSKKERDLNVVSPGIFARPLSAPKTWQG
jgi:hypothetical protein